MQTTTSPRTRFLPYGRQYITQEDIEAVTSVLQSDWLTQGPSVPAFERELARTVGADHAVACANGTAALHIAMLALGIGPGDEVVTSPNSFLASANCARYVGADVRFVDIDPSTGLMNPALLQKVLREDRKHVIKAVIPVHFAGQPADLPAIYTLAHEHGAKVVDDACHALGASYEFEGRTHRVGSGDHSDMTVFSFHPVKHIAMGEGGAVATNDDELASRLSRYRNHGMQKEDFEYQAMALSPTGETNPWYYEMQDIGFNYRLSDIHAALGLSQLKRLAWSLERRQTLAQHYRKLLGETFSPGGVRPLVLRDGVAHGYHLFTVLIDFDKFGVSRAEVMNELRNRGIGTQVHYIPIHLQPYYRTVCGTKPGDCPSAEAYYESALSLPMYPNLTGDDVNYVVESLRDTLGRRL